MDCVLRVAVDVKSEADEVVIDNVFKVRIAILE